MTKIRGAYFAGFCLEGYIWYIPPFIQLNIWNDHLYAFIIDSIVPVLSTGTKIILVQLLFVSVPVLELEMKLDYNFDFPKLELELEIERNFMTYVATGSNTETGIGHNYTVSSLIIYSRYVLTTPCRVRVIW